ncbi:MAG: EF-P lysine aminoacylase GenX [Candidatus Latescibacteria bacterium]|nr:EF-P lysine aminoacylase GenX [Candidatus Latescibacterota bacterium]
MELRINPPYPTRCLPATHGIDSLPEEGGWVRLHGRLIECSDQGGLLGDGRGQVPCLWDTPAAGLHCGDIAELEGQIRGGVLRVEKLKVLAPALRPPGEGEGAHREQKNGELRSVLALRARVMRAIRNYFAEEDFLEVETPILVRAPGQEAHLLLFETEFRGGTAEACCLVSSPELHMKRLLGTGCGRIFQLSRAFRNGERSALHHPEFTMLEWYRAYASYEEIMADVERLVAAVSRAVRGTTQLEYQGRQVELAPPWIRLTVQEAFRRFAGLNLDFASSREVFLRQARGNCPSVDTGDSWEEIFFKVFLEKVEPALALGKPVLLKDYPACMAALAKIAADGQVAERVEAYVGGLELANGFTELNDPREQRRRFGSERLRREEQGYPLHPQDEEFLQMMEQGMPPAGGMALGVDRLVMLMGDAAVIDEVIPFPFDLTEGCR